MSFGKENLWIIDDVIKATGGQVVVNSGEKSRFKGISTDSRKIEPGNIFVALVGERFDGHDFLLDAVRAGAECLIIDKPLESFNAGKALLEMTSARGTLPAVVRVGNTLTALGDLAKYRRSFFKGPVVGVTGSNGKTSTKEMIAQVLDGSFHVLKNPMNWNNNVGLPLSLLQLEPYHSAVVLEMGINHPGEMDQLVAIASPTVGVITNIQKAHLEGLESEEVICREKTKLWHALPQDTGCAIVNRDDPWLYKSSERLQRIAKIFFGIKGEADVTVEGEIRCSREGTTFNVRCGRNRATVSLSVLGEHFALNALSALAVGVHLGVPLDVAAHRLSSWKPVSHRMECVPLSDGTVIVDDTYNANPGSMLRAIETVAGLAYRENRPFIAVLGDMKELGDASEELHRMIGRELARRNVSGLFTLGTLAGFIADEGRKGGIPVVIEAHDHSTLIEAIIEHWLPGAWLLVKGSRSMRMEQVVEGLVEDART
ncbi:MAG: UDP-N-acetylmuramoyl-tripeptide--D-alanyl-D-alanine ligase [Thermodesulforhabdaceae bacterium]